MEHDSTHSEVTEVPHHPHGDDDAYHPGWSTYWKVATILTLITVVEVWIYYIPSFAASRAFVTSQKGMSAVKLAIGGAGY